MTYLYCIAGLTVSSDIVLTGARATHRAADNDVVVHRASVPESLVNPSASGRRWEADREHFLLRIQGVGRFLLIYGREIRYQPETAARASESEAYLLGTVFGLLLHQRGLIVLHASAVAMNDEAVLFCGPSGSGKSTLAAALCQRGYPLLGDDFCAIAFDSHGQPRVSADSKQHKLTSESIASLNLDERRGAAIQQGLAKYFVEPRGASGPGDFPLGAIYFLEHQDRPSIATLTAAEAARQLVASAYRPRIVNRMGQKSRYFEAAVAILHSVCPVRLTLARHLTLLPESISLVENHWAQSHTPDKHLRTSSATPESE